MFLSSLDFSTVSANQLQIIYYQLVTMALELTKSNTGTKLVYGTLLRFKILEDIVLEETEGIARAQKMMREEEEGRKEYP